MLTLWKPRTVNTFETLFDDIFKDLADNKFENRFNPDLDIKETDKEYIVEAELPGMEKKDIKVTYENGAVLISGEKKYEKEEKDKAFHRVERRYGKFVRRIPVDESAIQTAQVSAEMKNGVLRIELPKSEQKQTKEISIDVK